MHLQWQKGVQRVTKIGSKNKKDFAVNKLDNEEFLPGFLTLSRLP